MRPKKKYHVRGKFLSKNRVMTITLAEKQILTKEIVMRRLLFALMAVLSLGGALAAYAGPAWALPPDPCSHH